jgi:light-regulated signal transduction histidine kinase (bacteriophytochrome)
MAFHDGAVHTVEKSVQIGAKMTDIEVTASPLRDSTGEIIASIELVRDISERKAVEEEILKLNKDLERRAQELADANRDMKAFGYSLSHDLKTPLTAIYSAAQILDDVYSGQLDETGRFCVGSICKASERMEELFDAMLHLSRISRRELQHEEIDLSLLTSEILARLKKEEPGRAAEFMIEPELTAHGDTPLIKSVLENLLGNAWKYTRNKSVTRIEFGVIEEKGEKVFFIRDNGAGFDMKHAQSLFTPFQRLHTEEEFKGTGVGLATVHRIIQRHGGRLWGEGEQGRGATFFFTLPDTPGNADSPEMP